MSSLARIKNNKLPLSVSMEINNVCNAKCTFCAYGKEKIELVNLLPGDNPVLDNRPKQHLSKEVFDHVMKLCETSGSGVMQKLSITPTLGESTVSKNWLDFIRSAKNTKGVKSVSSYTNAISLHYVGIENIIDSGINVLEISSSLVDRKSYKRLYGRDKYDQVLTNIIDILKMNRERGYPIDIYLNLRIDLPSDEFFKSDQYRTLSKYIEKRKISFLEKYDNYGGSISEKDLPIGAEFVKRNNNTGRPPCYQLYRQLMVNVDGVINACTCRIDESLFTRNIMEFNSIEDAWRNDKYEKIRKNWEEGILPKACTYCTHYGPYHQLQSYYKVYPRVKAYISSHIKGSRIYSTYRKLFYKSGSIKKSSVNEGAFDRIRVE